MTIQKFYIKSPSGYRLASRHEFAMLHPGHSLGAGDFIELLEGIFELNEELVPIFAVELGDYPKPDPLSLIALSHESSIGCSMTVARKKRKNELKQYTRARTNSLEQCYQDPSS